MGKPIPAKATLKFELELLSFDPPESVFNSKTFKEFFYLKTLLKIYFERI
jgi:hypothetical protein